MYTYKQQKQHSIRMSTKIQWNFIFNYFWKYDIETIIKNLDPNKSHGYDKLSVCMLKMCDQSIYQPLNLLLKSCLETGQFPS